VTRQFQGIYLYKLGVCLLWTFKCEWFGSLDWI